MQAKRLMRFLTVLVVCFLLLGCAPETPQRVPGIGVEETLCGNNTITVVSAEVTDGVVLVKVMLDFENVRFSDLTEVGIQKSEVGATFMEYDKDATVARNPETAFDAPYRGEMTLVFQNSSDLLDADLRSYCIFFTHEEKSGFGHTIDFVLYDYRE